MLGLHFTPVCVLLSVCSLHFTLSLHFTPGPQSAVCSLQSAVCVLHWPSNESASLIRTLISIIIMTVPLAFKNVRLLSYVSSLQKTFDVCKSKRFQITRDMPRFAKIEVVLQTVHSEISQIICSVLSLSFFVVRFVVNFWNYPIAETLHLNLEKDSRQLYFDLSSTCRMWQTQIRIHVPSHVCSKNKHTILHFER